MCFIYFYFYFFHPSCSALKHASFKCCATLITHSASGLGQQLEGKHLEYLQRCYSCDTAVSCSVQNRPLVATTATVTAPSVVAAPAQACTAVFREIRRAANSRALWLTTAGTDCRSDCDCSRWWQLSPPLRLLCLSRLGLWHADYMQHQKLYWSYCAHEVLWCVCNTCATDKPQFTQQKHVQKTTDSHQATFQAGSV